MADHPTSSSPSFHGNSDSKLKIPLASKNNRQTPKALPVLYFDFDGTLHNSMVIYEPAFRAAYRWLVEEGHTLEGPIKSEEISAWLGLSKLEMWSRFMPDLSQEITATAGKIIGDTMVELTESGQAQLYEETEAVLDHLKSSGYRMVMVSNCGIRYMDIMRKHFDLDQWFCAYYVAEAYGWQEKEHFLREAVKAHGGPAVMIGDRYKDILAGKKNEAMTIGCTYGYGSEDELVDADISIDSIAALINLLINDHPAP